MKSEDIFKGIFGLATRLLGLLFLYFGLSAVTPLLDLGAIETANAGDIITAILPIIFNLAVGWWLIGGGVLIRRAYPEVSRFFPHSQARAEAAPTARSEARTDMDAADKKLAALVTKPQDGRPA